MSLDEKITEIMTRVGVAHRDFAASRRNLERLGPDEIDLRLTKLREGSAKIDAWRGRKNSGHSGLKLQPSALSVMEESIETVARVDRNLKSLTEIIRRIEPVRARTGLLGAITEKRKRLVAALQDHLHETATSSKFEEFLLERIEAVSSSAELAVTVALRNIKEILSVRPRTS